MQRVLSQIPARAFHEAAADVDDYGPDIADATNVRRSLAGMENIYHIDVWADIVAPAQDPYELPLFLHS